MRKFIGGLVVYAIIIVLVIVGLSSFSFANNSGSPDAVEVIACWVSDQGNDPPDYEKNVAQCLYTLTDLDSDGYNDLELTIENGYPGYECLVYVTLHNMSAGNATITGATWTAPVELTIVDSTAYPVSIAADNPAGDDDEAFIIFTTIVEQGTAYNSTYQIEGAIDIIGEETP